MFFIFLLIFITLCIAGSAAFFSIYGLAHIFEGAFIPVIIMGSVLEAGKLIGTSFLYRYWDNIKLWLKTYLIGAILVLMLLTSTGIYGFLSNAHQQNALPLEEIQQKLSLLNNEKSTLQTRLEQIDKQVANLPNNYVNSRKRLIKTFDEERKRIDTRIQSIITELYDLNNKSITQRSHIGPIVFIAKALNQPIDNAISYMILLIMFSFDPLAIALTIGVNIALSSRKNEQKTMELQLIPK